MNKNVAMMPDAPCADRATALSALVDEFLMLVAETAEYHAEPAIRAVMQEAQRSLLIVLRRLRVASERYVVGVVGLTNVGKSTLLNALLGDELAPRRNGPCTAAPIEFVYGSEIRLTTLFQQGLQRPSWQCGGIAEVHQRLEVLADDAGAEASQAIRRITVELPCPLLKGGLVIADTPGFGAAQAGHATGSHEQALRDYITNDVSQVFWVVLAEQGIGKSEMKFHDQFFAGVCEDVIVTGCEGWDQTDRDRFRRRFSQLFGRRLPQFRFVSGLEGLRARQAHDEGMLEQAGITKLEERIRDLASPSGRTAAISETLLTLAADLRAWLIDNSANEWIRTTPWRPDSWDRFSTAAARNDIAAQLVRRLEFPT